MSILDRVARPYVLQTPLAGHELNVRSFAGEEAVSKLFQFRVVVDAHPHIPVQQLLGQNVTFVIQLRPAHVRKFLARIRSVEELGADEQGRTVYTLELVPRLWEFTQTVRSRIFMNATAMQIIESVFSGSGIRLNAHTRSDEKARPYCVQYFESDFDFVVRLLEEEGYIYQCGIESDAPALAIHCFPSSFPRLGPIPFHEVTGSTEERIGHWQKTRILAATELSARDHYFQAASPVLKGMASVPQSNPAIPGWEPLDAGANARLNQYPGNWAHLFEEVNANGPATGYTDFGNNRTWSALRQAVGSSSGSEGASNCPFIAPAAILDLVHHPTAAGEYFVVAVRHKGSQNLDHSSRSGHDFAYENQFNVVPYAETMMYLPPRSTRKPVIHGCQTATVLGAPGSGEIWTDQYGRVQVRFWWDEHEAQSSCWVRVATPWAGNGWGIQHIPRVGQEVVVTFLDGDPDRPLIVGSVYNPGEMPPFALPANKTQCGIRTRSTPQGGAGESNEIRFEDAREREEIYIQAQRDRTTIVKNDSRELVGNNRYDVVVANLDTTVGGDKSEAIAGDANLTVSGNCMTACENKLGIAASEIHLNAKTIVIEAEAISLRAPGKGKEFIHLIGGGGITIDSKGDQVWMNCGGSGAPDEGCFKKPKQPVNPFVVEETPE